MKRATIWLVSQRLGRTDTTTGKSTLRGTLYWKDRVGRKRKVALFPYMSKLCTLVFWFRRKKVAAQNILG